MKRFRVAVVLAATFAVMLAGSARAVGTVDLSWDACSPLVTERMNDGAHPYSLYASVLGHDTPHKAYQVFIRIGRDFSWGGGIYWFPDAWRFDAPGCQTSSLIRIDHLAPASVSKACPSFLPSSLPTQSLQIKDFSFDPLTDRARAVLANSYPGGSTTTTDPTQRYFLARFEFDHTYSVAGAGAPAETCGGFERDMGFEISAASWLDLAGDEHAWNTQSFYVAFRGSPPTPATSTTWGAIKGQYRR